MSTVSSVRPEDSASNITGPTSSASADKFGTVVSVSAKSTIGNEVERFSLENHNEIDVPGGTIDFITAGRAVFNSRGVPVDVMVPVLAKVWFLTEEGEESQRVKRLHSDEYVISRERALRRWRSTRYFYRLVNACHPEGPSNELLPPPAVGALNVCLQSQPGQDVVEELRHRFSFLKPCLAELGAMVDAGYVYNATTKKAFVKNMFEIVEHLHAEVNDLFVSMIAPDGTSKALTVEFILQEDGAPVAYPLLLKSIIPIMLDWTLHVHPPDLKSAISVLGTHGVWKVGFEKYVDDLRDKYLDGIQLEDLILGNDGLRDDDRDLEGLSEYSPNVRFTLVRSYEEMEKIPAVIRYRLYWDLSTFVETYREGRPTHRLDVGGLMPFTVCGKEEPLNFYDARGNDQVLETLDDIVTLAPVFGYLARDVTALAWRQNAQSANARFWLGDQEGVVAHRLQYVWPRTKTIDTTICWTKAWLWYELWLQIKGMHTFYTNYDFSGGFSEARATTIIRIFPENWDTVALLRTQMWECLRRVDVGLSLVLRRRGLTWTHVLACVSLTDEWPLFDIITRDHYHTLPWAQCIHVSAMAASTLLIVISDDLMMFAPSHDSMWEVSYLDLYAKCNLWRITSASIANAIADCATALEYNSACVYGRHVASLLANGRDIQREDGYLYYAMPAFLNTDTVLLPRPKFRPPLAIFFTQREVSLVARSNQPLNTFRRATVHEHLRATLAYSLSLQCAAQTIHDYVEFHPWGRFLLHGASSRRQELAFMPGAVDFYELYLREGNGFSTSDEGLSDYLLAVVKVQMRMIGMSVPVSVACRLQLWSSCDHKRGLRLEDLIQKAIVSFNRLMAYMFPDEVLSVACALPTTWPLMLTSDKLDVSQFIREDTTVEPRDFEWSTVAVHEPHLARPWCKADNVSPPARMFLSALGATKCSVLIYPAYVPTPREGVVSTRLHGLFTARGHRLDVVDVDRLRSWDPMSGNYHEFSYREKGLTVASQKLRESGRSWLETINGLATLVPATRITPLVLGGLKRQKRSHAIPAPIDVDESAKRAATESAVAANL